MSNVAEDQLSARIRQLAIFLPNRLGALLTLTRALDAADVNLRALSVLDAADHAVVRIVVDQPTLAAAILTRDGYSYTESDLLAVRLKDAKGIRGVLTALIVAELNIHYLYPLMSPRGGAILALHVEETSQAAAALLDKGHVLLCQDDLQEPR